MLYSFANRKPLNELERLVNETAIVAFSSRRELQDSKARTPGLRERAVTKLYVASISRVSR